jgi:hypothetical protein
VCQPGCGEGHLVGQGRRGGRRHKRLSASVHAATSISSGQPPGTLRGAPPPIDTLCYCTVCFAGHVDNLARFARPGVVVLTWCDDPSDPQYEVSRDALARLTAGTDARGRRLEVRATRTLCPCVSSTRGPDQFFPVYLCVPHAYARSLLRCFPTWTCTHPRGKLLEIHTGGFAPSTSLPSRCPVLSRA